MVSVVSKDGCGFWSICKACLSNESGSTQRVPWQKAKVVSITSTGWQFCCSEVEEVEYDIGSKRPVLISTTHLVLVVRTSIRLWLSCVSFTCQPISVEMQEERTSRKDPREGHEIIRARVADHFAQIARMNKTLNASSTRHWWLFLRNRIRTYNFPQNVSQTTVLAWLPKLDTTLSGKLMKLWMPCSLCTKHKN